MPDTDTRASVRRRPWSTAPAPLRALLGAVAVIALAWSLVTPAFMGPDEQSHFGYVQHLAETGGLPGTNDGAEGFSSEFRVGAGLSGMGNAAQQPDITMEWNASVQEEWKRRSSHPPENRRDDGGGPGNSAASNPPLYYLTAVPAYLVGEAAGIFTRVGLVRLVSIAWLLVAVVGAWLLAGELFGRDRRAQSATAGVVGLLPMSQFIAGTVGPDTAVFAAWAFVMWLGVRLLRRGASVRGVFWLSFALGVACLLKAASYALAPPVGLLVLYVLWKARRRDVDPIDGRTFARGLAVAAAALVGTLGVWLVVARIAGVSAVGQASAVTGGDGGSLTGLFSYVWQYYLPMLPGMDPAPGQPDLPVYRTMFITGWGAFAWLEVRFPDWIYPLLLVGCLAVVAVAARTAWERRTAIRWPVIAFFALIVVGLVAGMHITEFNMGGYGFIQGRYLLPLAPLAGLILAVALRGLPGPARTPALSAVLGTLVVLNAWGMGLAMERFYA
ncbi:MAG: DUF2142 domain-containing protein [Solirubrobacteraceae bacterium]